MSVTCHHPRLRESLVWALAALALFALVPVAQATNGYFAHGYGAQCKALAGACVALPLDTLTVATNPAGLAFVGKRYDVGIAWFNPNRSYEIKGDPSGFPGTFPLTPGKVESDSTSFIIPNFGANWQVGRASLGIAVYGHGGMNTDYPTVTFFHPLLPLEPPTGVNLEQLFVVPTWAKAYGGGKHAFGLSPVFVYQTFEADGLGAFSGFSVDPTSLTNNGKATSTGFGFKAGYLGQWTPKFSFGIGYQSKMNMGNFDEYSGLFAEEGGFDIPSSFTAGVAIKATQKLTITMDYQEILYSDVAAVSNPMFPNLGQCIGGDVSSCLGGSNGAGFGWEDMSVLKIGTQFVGGGSWTYRFGVSFGDQPIPRSEVMFNILAPGVMETHITAGATKKIGDSKALHFSLMRAPSTTVTGINPLEFPGAQSISITMDQWDFEVGYSFGF